MCRPVLAAFLSTLAIVGCSEGGSPVSVETPAKDIVGHGVSIKVPRSWDGRVEWAGPGYARIVHIASFDLPDDLDARGHAAERLLDASNVYVNVGLDPTLSSAPQLHVSSARLVSEWEGKVAEASRRAGPLTAAGGLLQAWVTFGSPPTASELGQVNAVLATLVASPA